MALDLQDDLQFDDSKGRLQNSRVLKGQTVDLDALAMLAVGLRNLRVSIDVGESIQGTRQIDLADYIAQFACVLAQTALDPLISMKEGGC